ncbi:glycosyltransferase [Roseibium sp.]|uniref:glycosyltransferase n=1 Tax=Roseibium sp. TaxID=1936156 RepID=UPI003A96FA9C
MSAHTQNPSAETEQELQTLVGTVSSFSDVQASMESMFDEEYYLSAYPDLGKLSMSPRVHYLTFGWKENRSPSPYFDLKYYQQSNPELAEDEFPLAHYVRTGGGRTGRANPVSNTSWFTPRAPSGEQWAAVPSACHETSTRTVVIIPVYKGYDESLASIYHALASRGGAPYSLLVVNDKSPDPELASKLEVLAADGLFDYAENPQNLGFVRTINRALTELSGDHDVILLNSDAYVFPGWFDRIIDHADRHPDVATITPLSNNATICSYPKTIEDNNLALEVAPDELDRLAAEANAGDSADVPTGVGFCFYMRRTVIEEIGGLDAQTFKIGYGEENDFCVRAMQAGYRNIVAGDVFVFHSGSVSFAAIKNENYTNGLAALAKKHPSYDRMVFNHINADPELRLRRNLDAARLRRALSGCTVFVTHRWSGGIDTYLAHEWAQLKARGEGYIILRVHEDHFVSIETDLVEGLFVPNLKHIDLRFDFAFVAEFLNSLSPSRIHLNSFAGLTWEWHRALLNCLGALGTPLTYIGHDYAPISHYYQLLRPDNVYEGPHPTLERLTEWGRMKDQSGSVDICDPAERQAVYRAFFKKVERIILPSMAARDIYAHYFPEAKLNVVEHLDHLPETAWAERRSDDGIIRIAVVGAIGTHKGYDVLLGLAADAKNRSLPIEYHLIGYSRDDGLLGLQGVKMHGRFSTEAEAMAHLDAMAPDMMLVPSIWPETFCYTLSMALKKGIPPVVFDLGAQGERVADLPWGKVLPQSLAAQPPVLSDALLELPIAELWAKRSR